MLYSDIYVLNEDGSLRALSENEIIQAALSVLDGKIKRQGKIASPDDAKAFVSLKLGALQYEVFAVIFLDAQNRIIEYKEMFRGSLTQASVYPREVVKEAMLLNSANVILTHNHPSGEPEQSRADERLTEALKSALSLIDVRVLDHLVVGGGKVLSFAERGLI